MKKLLYTCYLCATFSLALPPVQATFSFNNAIDKMDSALYNYRKTVDLGDGILVEDTLKKVLEKEDYDNLDDFDQDELDEQFGPKQKLGDGTYVTYILKHIIVPKLFPENKAWDKMPFFKEKNKTYFNVHKYLKKHEFNILDDIKDAILEEDSPLHREWKIKEQIFSILKKAYQEYCSSLEVEQKKAKAKNKEYTSEALHRLKVPYDNDFFCFCQDPDSLVLHRDYSYETQLIKFAPNNKLDSVEFLKMIESGIYCVVGNHDHVYYLEIPKKNEVCFGSYNTKTKKYQVIFENYPACNVRKSCIERGEAPGKDKIYLWDKTNCQKKTRFRLAIIDLTSEQTQQKSVSIEYTDRYGAFMQNRQVFCVVKYQNENHLVMGWKHDATQPVQYLLKSTAYFNNLNDKEVILYDKTSIRGTKNDDDYFCVEEVGHIYIMTTRISESDNKTKSVYIKRFSIKGATSNLKRASCFQALPADIRPLGVDHCLLSDLVGRVYILYLEQGTMEEIKSKNNISPERRHHGARHNAVTHILDASKKGEWITVRYHYINFENKVQSNLKQKQNLYITSDLYEIVVESLRYKL